MATVLGIGTSQAVDLIDRLAAKSLIVRQSGAQGLRTAMLESVRAYSRDRAAEAGSDSDLRVAHLDWIDALTEDVAGQIRLVGSGSGAMADLDYVMRLDIVPPAALALHDRISAQLAAAQ